MGADKIAAALGGAFRSGVWWRCRCPVHNSRGSSLALRDGERRLIMHCHAGCNPRDIVAELRRRRIIKDRGEQRFEPRLIQMPPNEDSSRIAMARSSWESAEDARGSPVERYLRSRGIDIPPSACLRWAPACRHPSGCDLPAMLGRIDNVDGELIGIHRTYLRPDGSGKAAVEPVKAMLGRVVGGAVRLAPAANRQLVGEGIETVAAAMSATGLPGWAALSANGLERLILPSRTRMVVICADHDASGVGGRAAHNAARRWLTEGRCVQLVMARDVDTDIADLLIAGEEAGRCRSVT